MEFNNRNLLRFLGIIGFIIVIELIFWFRSPVSLIFGIIFILLAIFFYRKKLWEDRFPKVKFLVLGVLFSILWSIFYGFLEMYAFLNPENPLYLFQWFNSGTAMDYYSYWSLLIISNGLILMFISRNLTFSVFNTFFYMVNEDAFALTFFSIRFNIFPVFPSENWFQFFPEILPQWLISLGEPIPIWPYVPIIYVIIWSITVPSMIGLIVLALKYRTNIENM